MTTRAVVAQNQPTSNFAITKCCQAWRRWLPDERYVLETLMATVAQDSPEGRSWMDFFINARAGKVAKG